MVVSDGEKHAKSGLKSIDQCHLLLNSLSTEVRQSSLDLLRRYARSIDPEERSSLRKSLNERKSGLADHFDQAAGHLSESKRLAPTEPQAFLLTRKSAIHCHGNQKSETTEPSRSAPSRRWLECEITALLSPPPASRLWGKHADPTASLRPEAVMQGNVDNCYFLSTLASLASAKPNLLREMIAENAGSGTYTVCFPGAKDKKVTVEAPTERELERYAKSTEWGVWPAVLEKALGKFLKDNKDECLKLLGHELAIKNTSDLAQYTDGGGKAAMMLQLLTGQPASGIEIHRRRDPEPSHDLLKLAFHSGGPLQPVVATISESNAQAVKSGLTPRHAYSVLAYDPESKIITLRDPYGKAMQNSAGLAIETNKGVFRMRLDDFVQLFDELCCSNTSAPAQRGMIMMPRKLSIYKPAK
jgi:hypothetical protein